MKLLRRWFERYRESEELFAVDGDERRSADECKRGDGCAAAVCRVVFVGGVVCVVFVVGVVSVVFVVGVMLSSLLVVLH